MSSLPSVPLFKVQVYLYDLSHGMASQMSEMFLGRKIDGIWHTGVVVYGVEYFYGGGIQAASPGTTMAGQPMRVIDMGYTAETASNFHAFLRSISHRFTTATYSLLHWNCNNFSDEAVKFLTASPIPPYITGLPAEVLSSPMGAMFRPMIEQMQQGVAGAVPWGADELALPNINDRMNRPDMQGPDPKRVKINANNNLVGNNNAQLESAVNDAISHLESEAKHDKSAIEADEKSSASSSSSLQILATHAKPLSSSDNKAKSFYILIKTNSKKHDAAGLSSQQDTCINSLINKLASVGNTSSEAINNEELNTILQLVLTWSPSLLFPVLAIFRLIVLRKECIDFVSQHLDQLVARMIALVPTADQSATAPPPAATAMALCVLANALTHASLAARVRTHSNMMGAAQNAVISKNTTIKLMGAILAYNHVVTQPPCTGDEETDESLTELMLAIIEEVKQEENTDVAQRLLLCLGQLALLSPAFALLLYNVEFLEEIPTIQKRFEAHADIKKCLSDIKYLLLREQAAMNAVQ